MKQYALKG